MSAASGRTAVVAALAANTGIAITKFVAFAVSGSAAMLGEAVHSLADTVNQVLLLVGGARASRAPSATRPFGHGRVRYVYAFAVAVVLFVVGGCYSLFEGWHKLQHPTPPERPLIPLAVLGVACALELFSLRTALREAAKVREGRSLWQFIRRTREPELPVVLLEDIAALAGLVLALVAVSVATVTGDGRWDGFGAMSVGALLIVVAVILIVELSSLLVGESALPEQEEAILDILRRSPLFTSVIHLRTTHTAPDEYLVAVKVGVHPQTTAAELAVQIDDAESAIRAVLPGARWIYVEPDVEREKWTG